MKHYLLFIYIILITSTTFAQDIITKKSGEVIKAKIIFSDDLAIKYKLYNDPNGVIYLMLLKDINNILKEDGSTINGTSFNNTTFTKPNSSPPTNTNNLENKNYIENKTENNSSTNTNNSNNNSANSTNNINNQAFDILFKNSGEEIKVIVIEVGSNEITYKKYENLSGPNYKINNEEVMMIKYKNGTNEVLKKKSNINDVNNNSNTANNNSNENNYTKFERNSKKNTNSGTIYNYSISKKVFENHEEEIRIFASMGIKPLRTPQQSIEFNYTDESPSRDQIYNLFDIKKNIYSGSFRLGAAYQLKQNIFFKALLDFYFGRISGVSFDFGTGYSFEFNKFKLRPQVLFSFGYSNINLGDIYQNSIYIDVNNTRFYSTSVATKLRSNQVIFNPQIELAYRISKRIELNMDLGYNVAISKGAPYIYFTGEDKEEKSVSAKESINVSNMQLFINGDYIREQNIKFGYPTAHFGISFCLGN